MDDLMTPYRTADRDAVLAALQSENQFLREKLEKLNTKRTFKEWWRLNGSYSLACLFCLINIIMYLTFWFTTK